ncbi:MAG: clan AA aspartic protease [candidate division KSB1 bacterium]|nr:clan AA aspartic protease [candidate division KSB1 bacterium]MDZ7300709.1 clan AA aspartic protease [candidate division KSB1 bacterium]MDZ7310021.1 clan AA aspartic protease [candidate division KSB1 bacterium]
MGEVRTKVKLTNAADLALLRRNMLPPDKVHFFEADALIDTGAVSLILPSFVAEQLGLARPFKQVAEYADGRREEVDVTEPVLIEVLGRKTHEEALVLGDEVILGQTTLEKTDLHVDCRERRLLPNPAHPDQPVQKVKLLNRRFS